MDYRDKARKLRAKAADKAVGPEEREALLRVAERLEEKHPTGATIDMADWLDKYVSREGRKPTFFFYGDSKSPYPRDFYEYIADEWLVDEDGRMYDEDE